MQLEKFMVDWKWPIETKDKERGEGAEEEKEEDEEQEEEEWKMLYFRFFLFPFPGQKKSRFVNISSQMTPPNQKKPWIGSENNEDVGK